MNFCSFQRAQKGAACITCGYVLTVDCPAGVYRTCPGPACPHLGQPRLDKSGVALLVKCSCGGGDKTKEKWHQAHDCHAPEHRRPNGKPGQCLPTMQKAFDDDHAFEASIYHLCSVDCEVVEELRQHLAPTASQ